MVEGIKRKGEDELYYIIYCKVRDKRYWREFELRIFKVRVEVRGLGNCGFIDRDWEDVKRI